MKQMKINTETIYVPQSWDDITLGFYETWFDKAPKAPKEQIELVAQICKVKPELFLDCSVDEFNRILHTLRFVFSETKMEPSPIIVIDGVKYLIPIAESLTTGAWIDVEEAQRQKEKMLSSVLAITCLPVGETYDPLKFEARQQLFASLKVSEVLPLLGFFLHCKKALEQHSVMSSSIEELLSLYANNTVSFRSVGGGIKLSQIWRRVHYWLWIRYLQNRLRKCLRSFATN